jgi:hypothetical protein
MELLKKTVRYFINHPTVFILLAFIFASSAYATTTIGENITTGNLVVTGNATTTGYLTIGAYTSPSIGQPFTAGLAVLNATADDQELYGVAATAQAVSGSTHSSVYGVDGEAEALNGSTVTNLYGGYFRAHDIFADVGTSYGIYADASGGTTNYAGYFNGDLRVAGNATTTGWTFPGGDTPGTAPSSPIEGALAVDTTEQDCFDAADGTDGGSLCVYTGAAWVVVKTW